MEPYLILKINMKLNLSKLIKFLTQAVIRISNISLKIKLKRSHVETKN